VIFRIQRDAIDRPLLAVFKDDRMICSIIRKAGRRIALWAGAALLAACAPNAVSPQAATLVPFPSEAATRCVQEEVFPKITQVQPPQITPGAEILLVASGGYLKDSCGGYNESARTYPVYLDDEPAGELQCYVNHCEGKLRLPERTGVGRHCLGVQKGSCQMELEVVEE
jgi:hypothetical protein